LRSNSARVSIARTGSGGIRGGRDESLRRIQLQLLDDTQFEPVETVVIRLTSPVNAFLGPRDIYTHTIRASDAPTIP